MSEAPARRQALADFRRDLGERFRASRRAGACVRRLTARIDSELRQLWAQSMHSLDQEDPQLRACLVATGGYGRGQLFPGSDIDVLVLVPERRDVRLDAAVRAFLAAAWDLGLELAQAVRTLSGLIEFASEDLSGYTALLDARCLCGDEGLYGRMLAALRAPALWPPAAFLRAKMDERDTRHGRHADTAHNLEPNLKNGRGALRDLHTARWIAKRCFGIEGWPALVAIGLLEGDEARRLAQAERWLNDMRFALHVVSGRREERVLFDHQPALAHLFNPAGPPAGSREHPVEGLMHHYFRAAGDIDRLSQALVERMARRIDSHLEQRCRQLACGDLVGEDLERLWIGIGQREIHDDRFRRCKDRLAGIQGGNGIHLVRRCGRRCRCIRQRGRQSQDASQLGQSVHSMPADVIETRS